MGKNKEESPRRNLRESRAVQTELIPRCLRENSNEDPSWGQKELFFDAPAKVKRNPREGISGDFHSQVRSKLAPKGNKFRGA